MKRSKFFLLLMAAAALGSQAAHAGETCYGFSGLPDDKTFVVGETHQAEHLKMVVRPYVLNGNSLDPEGRFIKVQSTNLALSDAAEKSELYIYGVNMQIVPRQPVAQIRFRVAENKGNPTLGRHANLQINGKLHQLTGSLRDLDGREFGDENGRQYRVDVKLRRNSDTSDWFSGTMKVRALSGQIASFSIGGHPIVVDDVCLTPNAP
jgi:hypothetical protein